MVTARAALSRRHWLSGLTLPLMSTALAQQPFAGAVRQYWETLARPDGGYGWPDDPDGALTVTYAAVASFRLLGQKPPQPDRVAKFVRGAYPLAPARRKDRPLHRFEYEQIQTLLWLDEPVDEFRAMVEGWTQPSFYTKTYEMGENPVLQQETGAILSRRLLQLLPTVEWGEYIASRRRPNGSFNNTPGNDRSDGHVTNTLWGLLSLQALGAPVERKAETAEWVRYCQQRSGGFTYSPGGQTDHVDYTWAALKCFQLLGEEARNPSGARAYLESLWNEDGGFADRPGRASNPLATWQALDALSCLGSLAQPPATKRRANRREASLPGDLKIYTLQVEAPGVGSPREAAEMARALKIDLWGAKNSADGWVERAQELARVEKTPVTFFVSNEEYGTYIKFPGLGTYSHLVDTMAPAGRNAGKPLSDKNAQPHSWPDFVHHRLGPLDDAKGINIWQFNENEELSRALLEQALQEHTFAAISSFHFGSEHFLKTQPFLNRYRDVMPFVGLQDAHTQTWWWMEYLVAFRTFFLAKQPTWDGFREALRQNRMVGIRHDAKTDFRTQIAGGSNAVRQFVMDRQAQWKWWGDRPDELIRPWASLVAVTADEKFEEARPKDGVMLRLRCWMDTQPFGTPKIPVVELVSLEVDGKSVRPELVQFPPKAPDRGDIYHQWHVPPDQKGRHVAVATVKMIKTGATMQVKREFTV